MTEEIELRSQCMVYTYKEGLLSRIAHDLKLYFETHRLTWNRATKQLHGEFNTASLKVQCARIDGTDAPEVLSTRDKKKIEQSVQRDVLDSRKHPLATLTGTLEVGDEQASFSGSLQLCGVRRSLELDARRIDRSHNASLWKATHILHQPDFGIQPFTAALGTLKVKPHVEVVVTVEPVSEAG